MIITRTHKSFNKSVNIIRNSYIRIVSKCKTISIITISTETFTHRVPLVNNDDVNFCIIFKIKYVCMQLWRILVNTDFILSRLHFNKSAIIACKGTLFRNWKWEELTFHFEVDNLGQVLTLFRTNDLFIQQFFQINDISVQNYTLLSNDRTKYKVIQIHFNFGCTRRGNFIYDNWEILCYS